MSKWDFEKSAIYIFPPPGIPPEIWKRWIDDLRGNSPDGGPYSFSIELKMPEFVPTRRDVSHIHSAFLMMFYQFGYEYVLWPNADSIRKMFNGNDLSWKPNKLIRSAISAPESQGQQLDLPLIGIVIDPKELCSFAVNLPSLNNSDSVNTVFLPGFDEQWCNFYKKQEMDLTPNKKYTMIYPTRIRLHNPDTDGSSDLPYKINYDINNPDSKGYANKLYQLFTKMEKPDVLNTKIKITIKSDTVQ